MKQRKPTSLFLPLLWFIATGLWGISFFRTLASGSGGYLLQGATALACLLLAVINLRRYLRDRR